MSSLKQENLSFMPEMSIDNTVEGERKRFFNHNKFD